MSSLLRKSVLILCFSVAFTSFTIPASAHSRFQDNVRIGLYYNGSYSSNKAQSSFRINNADGVTVGFTSGGGEFKHLYDFKIPSGAAGMDFSKYSFGKKFAVTTGRETGSLSGAANRVKELQQKGYDPQLAYIGGWTLVVDFYESPEAAQQAIDSVFKKTFKTFSFTAESLSSKYILISIGNARQFIYDTGTGNLQARPAAAGTWENPALLELNGKPYRGAIEFVRNTDSDMTAVNCLMMNEYLYGVVPREIGASSPAEALKAQAIAARTYTVITMQKHGSHGFDLCTSTHCQVYGGYEAEDPRPTHAVNETTGKIVTYKGEAAQVFYFASSGGHTANVGQVWGGYEYPYLAGVEDKYESGDSYNYNWETVMTAGEIRTALANSGVNIGDITGVAVTGTGVGGYVTELTITGTGGTKVYTNGSCRTAFKGVNSQVYSVYASVAGKPYSAIAADGAISQISGSGDAVNGNGQTVGVAVKNGTAVVSVGSNDELRAPEAGSYIFIGKGWGHGVGMSQEGAKGMAAAGFSCTEILTHYFPGCEVG